MNDIEPLSNKFMCIECGNEFVTFEQLKGDYSTTHSQEVPLESRSSFSCEICQKSFTMNML